MGESSVSCRRLFQKYSGVSLSFRSHLGRERRRSGVRTRSALDAVSRPNGARELVVETVVKIALLRNIDDLERRRVLRESQLGIFGASHGATRHDGDGNLDLTRRGPDVANRYEPMRRSSDHRNRRSADLAGEPFGSVVYVGRSNLDLDPTCLARSRLARRINFRASRISMGSGSVST